MFVAAPWAVRGDETPPDKTPADDAAAAIRRAIPMATAMSLQDFDAMATSTTAPKESDFEAKTLTLMLFAQARGENESEAERKELRFLTDGTPKPNELAAEAARNVQRLGRLRVPLGPVTLIQQDRITKLTAKVDGKSAAGSVEYEVPKLYAGRFDYKATLVDEMWRIDEIHMPARGVHLVRNDKGQWTRTKQESQP